MSKRTRFMIFTILIGGALILALFSGIVYAEEERKQQFINDREVYQYEPIEIKYWSFSGKTWVSKVVDGSGGGSESLLEIIVLQNQQIIERLDYNNCALSHASVNAVCGERPYE